MALHHHFCHVGRSSHSPLTYGLFPILCNHRHTPSFAPQHCQSNLPASSTWRSSFLIAWCTVALQKCWSHLAALTSDVYTTQIKAAIQFKQEHATTIIKYNFKLGDLILIRNTAIEKSLNHKMRVRYLGPLTIISQNKGGAYIISELDGSVFDHPIAAF